jgi:hypothetical protein
MDETPPPKIDYASPMPPDAPPLKPSCEERAQSQFKITLLLFVVTVVIFAATGVCFAMQALTYFNRGEDIPHIETILNFGTLAGISSLLVAFIFLGLGVRNKDKACRAHEDLPTVLNEEQ